MTILIPAGAVVECYSPSYGTRTVGRLALPVTQYDQTCTFEDTEGRRSRHEGIITLVVDKSKQLS